ncbi:MAG: nitroreductase/quinone reductase family protein [Caldilineaceae bacterium]
MKTSTSESPSSGLQILSRRERIARFLERTLDTRLGRLGVGLYRLTGGRIVRLYGKDVLILTTRGRKSGQERTVLLQFFRDGALLVVVAANFGCATHPGWYHNLKANPTARIEVMDRTLPVRAEELSAEEAAAFWPRVLQRAPDYVRFLKRTNRAIPLMRLVPLTPNEGAAP